MEPRSSGLYVFGDNMARKVNRAKTNEPETSVFMTPAEVEAYLNEQSRPAPGQRETKSNTILNVNDKSKQTAAANAHNRATTKTTKEVTGKGRPAIAGAAGLLDAATQLELQAGKTKTANTPQAKYGEIYQSPLDNKLYQYMGSADGMSGYVIDIQSMTKLPVRNVQTHLNEANRVKNPSVKLGEVDRAAVAKLKAIESGVGGSRNIFLDFETRIKDVTQIDQRNVTELSLRSARLDGGQQDGSRVQGTRYNLPGDKLDRNNLKQLSYIFDIQAKDTKLARIYRKVHKGVQRAEGTFLLHDNVKISSKHVVTANDILDNLRTEYSTSKSASIGRDIEWMENYIDQSGDNAAFIFESDFKNPANAKAHMKKFWSSLHGAKKQGTKVFAFNSPFDDTIIKNITGESLGITDVRTNVLDTYAKLFPEASSKTLSMVNTFKPMLQKLQEQGMGKNVASEAMIFFSRGMNTQFPARTNQEDVYNYIVDRIAQKGPGVGVKELHSGSDNAQAEKIMTEVINPEQFINKAQQFYADMNLSLHEGVVHDTVKLMFADNYIRNHPKYHGRLSEYKNLRTEAIANYDREYQAMMANNQAAKNMNKRVDHINPDNKVPDNITVPRVAHRVPKQDAVTFRKAVESNLGTVGVNQLLSSVILGGSIDYVKTKIKNIRDKVAPVENLDGMNHFSLQTVIRRLAMTDFGSSWRGLLSTTIKETSKLLFKNNRPGTNASSLISTWNKTFKRGATFGYMFKKQNITNTINSLGRTMSSEMKISDKPFFQKFGNMLSNFKMEGMYTRTKGRILEGFDKQMGLSGTNSFESAIMSLGKSDVMKKAKPWIKFGFGTALVGRMMAKIPLIERSEYPEHQDIKPRDTFQKEAFANQEHRLGYKKGTTTFQPDKMSWYNVARRQTLMELGRLKDTGIGSNMSDSTKFRRAQMTDFGSSLKLDSTSSMEYSLRAMSDGGIKNNRPADPIIRPAGVDPKLAEIIRTRLQATQQQVTISNKNENHELAKAVYDLYNDERPEKYVRNTGSQDMQELTSYIDPISPFISRMPKPVVGMPESRASNSIGLRMSPAALENSMRKSHNDYLPSNDATVSGMQYKNSSQLAGVVYSKLNRNDSGEFNISTINNDNKLITTAAGLVTNTAERAYPPVTGVTDIESRSSTMLNCSSPIVRQGISTSRVPNDMDMGTYGKMELGTPTKLDRNESSLGIFNMQDVATLTYDQTNTPMGHNAAAWNTNDHLYPNEV